MQGNNATTYAISYLCSACKRKLKYLNDGLFCPRCGAQYKDIKGLQRVKNRVVEMSGTAKVNVGTTGDVEKK